SPWTSKATQNTSRASYTNVRRGRFEEPTLSSTDRLPEERWNHDRNLVIISPLLSQTQWQQGAEERCRDRPSLVTASWAKSHAPKPEGGFIGIHSKDSRWASLVSVSP